LAVAGLSIPAWAAASDVTTRIPQQALNNYAAGLGPVSGSRTYTPRLAIRLVGWRKTAPSSPLKLLDDRTRGWLPLGALPWNWAVIGPEFRVDPAGVTFQASLWAQMGERRFIRHLSIPTTVRFNSSSSQLELDLTSMPAPVFFSVWGQVSQVGSVDVAPYFSIHLPIGQASISAPGRSLSGSLQNVDVRLLPQVIEASGDVVFH
jgi:hypothetical protein